MQIFHPCLEFFAGATAIKGGDAGRESLDLRLGGTYDFPPTDDTVRGQNFFVVFLFSFRHTSVLNSYRFAQVDRLLTRCKHPLVFVCCFVSLLHLQLGNVLIRASADPGNNRKFEIEYGSETMIAPLKQLIDIIPKWTHLFPDTPKQEALAGVR